MPAANRRPGTAAIWRLGIEPVCSALGLGNKVSQAENPLVQDGEPTAARFRPGEIWRTQYRLDLEPLA